LDKSASKEKVARHQRAVKNTWIGSMLRMQWRLSQKFRSLIDRPETEFASSCCMTFAVLFQ
jgi:hypothetical protein